MATENCVNLKPKVSVAMCTYNGEKFVEEQILSILSQNYPVDEIVISDDGSTDHTIEIIRKIQNTNTLYGNTIKLLFNSQNHGVVGNFTNAISNCKNDIIFTSDQDDVWLPNKVDMFLNKFQNKNCNLVFSDAFLTDRNLIKYKYTLWNSLKFKSKKFNRNQLRILLRQCVVTGATMAFKKTFFNRCLPISHAWLHDGWLSICAAIDDSIYCINDCTIYYRQHGDNVVGAGKLSLKEMIKRVIPTYQHRELICISHKSRYEDVYKYMINNGFSRNIKRVSNCIQYWNNELKMQSCNWLYCLFLISKNFFSFKYFRYGMGFLDAIRDFLFITFRSRRKNAYGNQ